MRSSLAQSIATAMVLWDLVPRAGIWPAAWLAMELMVGELENPTIGVSLLIYLALALLSLRLR